LFGYGIPDFKLAYNMLLQSAINESEESMEFYLFPNPATDMITLSFSSSVPDNLIKQIVLFDLYGKHLQTFSIKKPSMQIDVSFLSKGVYFLQIIDKQGNSRPLKFIKY
jgi:hypothetical protein